MVGQSHTVVTSTRSSHLKKKNWDRGVGAVLLLFLLLQCCVLFTFLCLHQLVFFLVFFQLLFLFKVFRLNLMTLPSRRLLYAEANV